MKYEFKEQDVYDLANFVNIDVKDDGDEIQFKYCPYCHGGQHKDKETFAVNRITGKFNCLRSSCGKQGHFVTLARDMGYALDFGIEGKEYRKLPQRKIKMRPKVAELLKSRGIGLEVCERYHLTVRSDNPNIIVFPFYNDSGVLVTIKYRNAKFRKGIDKNKEWFEKDTQPILFGMEQAKDYSQPLVITEGQIDALSLAECGIPNTVSVPNGCTSFTWVPACFDWVMRFPYLVVMGDNENGKITLVNEIAKKFKMSVYYVPPQNYYGLKDANDILQMYGKETLLDSFKRIEEYMVPHVKWLSDVEDIDFSTMPKIVTGIKTLDEIIGGFYDGQVILLTGRRGEGKSTLMGQLILEAVDQGHTVLAYSGELAASHFKNWVDCQAAGSDHMINFGTEQRPVFKIPDEVHRQITEWYSRKILLYDNESVYENEHEELIQTIENTVLRYGVKMVCIDNLMTAMDVDSNEDIYRAQSSFLRSLKQLAMRYNIVILLVAHPKKTSEQLNNDSVSGSGDITNRVDTVIIYSRDSNPDDTISQSTITVTKNRLFGKLTRNPIRVIYSNSSKRITEYGADIKHYGWEQPNDWYDSQQNWDDILPF